MAAQNFNSALEELCCCTVAANEPVPTAASAESFLDAVEPARRREDAHRVCAMMARVSGEAPVMWGSVIVGFGNHHYRYASGREGHICRVGFSPRKVATVLFLSCDLDRYQPLLDRLGKHEGEGSPSDRDESHYRSFIAIQEELAALSASDASFAPAWPVADSPVLRRQSEPDGMVFIDHPEAARLLDFACATYGLLLRCLVQCFGRAAQDPVPQQKALVSAAINLMHVLGDVSTRLARLPASQGGGAVHAGMSFTLLRGVEPLLGGEVEKRLLVERVAALARSGHGVPGRVKKALESAAKALVGL